MIVSAMQLMSLGLLGGGRGFIRIDVLPAAARWNASSTGGHPSDFKQIIAETVDLVLACQPVDEVLVHGNAREPRAMLRGLLLARGAAGAATPTPLPGADAAARDDDTVEAALLELVPLDEPVRRGAG